MIAVPDPSQCSNRWPLRVNDYWRPVRSSYLPRRPGWVPKVSRPNLLHGLYGHRIGSDQQFMAQKGEWLWYVTDPSVNAFVSCPGGQETTCADHGFGPASTSLGRLVESLMTDHIDPALTAGKRAVLKVCPTGRPFSSTQVTSLRRNPWQHTAFVLWRHANVNAIGHQNACILCMVNVERN